MLIQFLVILLLAIIWVVYSIIKKEDFYPEKEMDKEIERKTFKGVLHNSFSL